ncbi:NAD-dependent epimerase/dehydratase family protein [Xylophilus rhododendri]|uniref:NAD-dependent epimerase/dehydratase family protein n=1 Tax=Xylophilus rhododendri TaxID=2697032 RepID=A0A857J218_9BURK|nr:NAD(P)-dependent oxidoreductase [Xylophilus rhododendri]QHI97964.1 NAD-dependent epimerase/dehydratase family protein [Xylophilus rhododendri]
MRIFLTGATGFVGRHVLAALLADGHSVRALDRAGLAVAPAGAALAWLPRALHEIGPADLADVDVLVHLASAGVPPQLADAPTLLRINVEEQTRLLTLAADGGVRRWVLAGSVAEYGRSADGGDAIPPDAPLLPTEGYAASKAAGFVLAHALAVERGVELAYLRLCPAFGEGQHAHNLWPALRDAALEGRDFAMTAGEQLRDYVPVARVAAAFVHAVRRQDLRPGQPWVRNVGSGQPVSVRQFAEHWWRHWQAPGRLLAGSLPYRPHEPMRFVPRIDDDVWPAD